MRASFLRELYDENDFMKLEELRRLTPGTPEFAVLDATLRRVRRSSFAHADFKRMNPALRHTRASDQELPGFRDDVLHTMRSLFQLGARSQNYVMGDDASSHDLAKIYMWLRQLALTEPAQPDHNSERPLISHQNFEVDLARDFATMQTRRGDPDPHWSVMTTEAAVPAPASTGRPFLPNELLRMKQHWCALGGEPRIDREGRSLTCSLGGGASLVVTSDAIRFPDMSLADERQRSEAMRLAVLHARGHWGASLRIDSYVPDFTLRVIAFSELLGVQVVGDHLAIPREQIEMFKSKLYALYPEGTFGPNRNTATTEPYRPETTGSTPPGPLSEFTKR
jgi:hypothetical protein